MNRMNSGRTSGTCWRSLRSAVRRAATAWVGLLAPLAALAQQPAAAPAAGTPGLPFVLLLAGLALGLLATAWSLWRTRAALGDSRQRLQGLADVLDVWQWHSDAAHRLTGLRPPAGAAAAAWSTSSLNQPLWEVFLSDDETAFRARLESRAPLDDLPAQHRGAGAGAESAVAVRLRARVRSDRDGRFAGYVGTLREVADAGSDAAAAAMATGPEVAVAVPAPLAAAASDADHEAFGYTVSHDLRAPIRVVEGFTRILKEDYGRLLDRIGNDHLDRVLGAAARMNAMIDALLALARLSAQPLARQSVNLSLLAGVVAEDLRRQWPERDVTLHIEPDLQVQGDPTLLRMMLENLLGNAWKYTGKNAEPCIWFERTAPDGAFTVRDNGAGFDMRFADRLFGVFQRLHSANDFQGTGIGLASVRRIVRRHGGEIWAEAEVDRGASFYFSLP